MKKTLIIRITAVIALIVLAISMVYIVSNFISNRQDKIKEQVEASNSVFTSKVIEEFAKNKDMKMSEIAQKTAKKLNTAKNNPYGDKEDFFVLAKDKKACSNIEADDNLKMIIVTTLDKNGELVARIVINPPSFVTYYKEK